MQSEPKSPAVKTILYRKWGIKGQEKCKLMQTIPEDWKNKSNKWMSGETFRTATRHSHKKLWYRKDKQWQGIEAIRAKVPPFKQCSIENWVSYRKSANWLQTIPEDWKNKSIKWMSGRLFWDAKGHNHKNSDIKKNKQRPELMHHNQRAALKTIQWIGQENANRL